FLNFQVDEEKVTMYQLKEPFATLLKSRSVLPSRVIQRSFNRSAAASGGLIWRRGGAGRRASLYDFLRARSASSAGDIMTHLVDTKHPSKSFPLTWT
ncbi:hypothetical protein DYH11_01115, partial [Candidatus Microgenomates bacterium CPR3]|nr:hypothetical protein [Candidatus Microgenomates bacterium CPR3]